VEFCYETLAEQRRERAIGDGVLLSTLHGAKGMEYPHALIADGGWSRKPEEANEERQVFYVGMTRARETLTLMENRDGHHPHLPLIGGDWLLSIRPEIESPAGDVTARRFTRLTLADLDLGFAGRQRTNAPIHRHLSALSAGDPLVRSHREGCVSLLDLQGIVVACLSRSAAEVWAPRLERIEKVRILAMLRRDRSQSAPAFAARYRMDRWEVPMVEIQWR